MSGFVRKIAIFRGSRSSLPTGNPVPHPSQSATDYNTAGIHGLYHRQAQMSGQLATDYHTCPLLSGSVRKIAIFPPALLPEEEGEGHPHPNQANHSSDNEEEVKQ